MSAGPGGYRLRRWTDLDLVVLEASNTAEMTRYLAGPESPARVRRRHEQYLRFWDEGMPRMYAIVDARGRAVGSIGWWESEWRDAGVYETGWAVLPAYQRHGAATAAVRLVAQDARRIGERRYLTAFPAVGNVASNAVCRAAGFSLQGTHAEDFRGEPMVLNVWVLDLDEPPDGHA